MEVYAAAIGRANRHEGRYPRQAPVLPAGSAPPLLGLLSGHLPPPLRDRHAILDLDRLIKSRGPGDHRRGKPRWADRPMARWLGGRAPGQASGLPVHCPCAHDRQGREAPISSHGIDAFASILKRPCSLDRSDRKMLRKLLTRAAERRGAHGERRDRPCSHEAERYGGSRRIDRAIAMLPPRAGYLSINRVSAPRSFLGVHPCVKTKFPLTLPRMWRTIATQGLPPQHAA